MEEQKRPQLSKALLWLVVLAAVAAAAVLFISLGRGPKGEAGEASPAETEPTLPPPYDFEVVDLAGQPVKLSDLRGQVVLVNLWASWCGPCREEMPVLQAFYDQHRADGFALVGINVSEDAKTAQAYIDEGGYTFPVWSDPPGDLLLELRFSGLPASVVFDREGRMVKRWLGPFDEASLDALLLPLLENQG